MTDQDTDPFLLSGEVALVTGGGTGLGLGIARCMIGAGASVVITGRREDVLRRAATQLGDRAAAIAHDVDDFDRAGELARHAAERFGPISILANNAGNHLKKPAAETTVEEFQSVLTTHLLAGHALTRALLPGMLERRHGSIIYTASMASLFGIPFTVAYAAAKTAMLGVVRTLATELEDTGVRVNAVAPGWIETDIVRSALEGDQARRTRILARTPMRRFGTPEDVGWAVVYLCSPAARFVTGVVLPVDGGASIGF